MPGCVAVGCSNSSKKGFLMKRFPKDAKRRKEWAIKTRRDKWTPTDSSVLCEVHFAPEMWEKTREDGSRKLKYNAVPTIFFFSKHTTTRKSPKRKLIKLSTVKMEVSETSGEVTVDKTTECATQDTAVASTSKSTSDIVHKIPGADSSTSTSSEDLKTVLFKMTKSQKLEKYAKVCRKMSIQIKKLRTEYRNATLKIARLQENVNQSDFELIKKVFNKDQISALRKIHVGKTTKFMKWSNETITKSLKLKFSCGSKGYEELLNQNLPYPSIRTLQRRLQNLKFDSGILHEVFNFLKLKVEFLNENERDCVLVLDEMAITAASTYDTSLNKYFRDVTLPKHEGNPVNSNQKVYTVLKKRSNIRRGYNMDQNKSKGLNKHGSAN